MPRKAGILGLLPLSGVLVWTICQSVTQARGLFPRTTIPAPIAIPASNNWEGNDGPWSTFTIEIGSPPQSVNVLISTASFQTWGVDPGGCTPSDPSDCTTKRGRTYNYSASASWIPNTANITTTIYELELESDLSYSDKSDKGRYGFDDIKLGYIGGGGPTLANQTVASIATKDFFVGLFGIKPQASNFTSFNDPIPSYMQNLRNKSMIPSLSWGYTAGNQYRLNEVYGSLTLGGYDSSKFVPNNLNFDFGPQDNRELLVQLNSISTDTTLAPFLTTPISMFLDSTVPCIYLPEAVCAVFESAFGLSWDNVTQLYLLDDEQHRTLKAQNPNITFTIGTLNSSTSVDIVLPYAAFDLNVSYPIVSNPTWYFPLKRANDSSQYILGRTFFQEAYVVADYERGNFSLSQCRWDTSAKQNIVAIAPPPNSPGYTNTGSDSSSSHHSIPITAIAGGAGGLVVILALAILTLLVLLQRKKKANELNFPFKAQISKIEAARVRKAELDSNPVSSETSYEVDGSQDSKSLAEAAGQEIVEIDPHGEKWPPTKNATEMEGTSSPVYEMAAAEEVANEMDGIGRMSFDDGDDQSPLSVGKTASSPKLEKIVVDKSVIEEPVSASSDERNVRYYVRDPSDIVSPMSPGFSPVTRPL